MDRRSFIRTTSAAAPATRARAQTICDLNLENVCYYRNVLLALDLIRQGMLGELLHCEGGCQHPLWKAPAGPAKQYPHGPADYIELLQIVKAVRDGTPTPIDVYDAATWSVTTPLSELSVASRSAAVDFPDFTRGKWNAPKPLQLEA